MSNTKLSSAELSQQLLQELDAERIQNDKEDGKIDVARELCIASFTELLMMQAQLQEDKEKLHRWIRCMPASLRQEASN